MLLSINHIDPSRTAAIDTRGARLLYQDIILLADKINSEIHPRSVVLTTVKNDIGAIGWILGLMVSGNIPLIISDNTPSTLLNNLIDIYHPQYICRPTETERLSGNTLFEFKGYSISSTGLPQYEVHPELSHLLPTSGSTGSPKLVRHKYENIEAAALNISSLFKLTEEDRPLMVLPIHYTMGLSIVFSHLKVGATILITDKPMTDPAFWKFMKEERATSFTGVPFSYEVLDKLRFTRMKLPDLTLLTQGGGKMPEELNRKFVEYCRDNGKRWIATYGQSEGTARMSWLPDQHALDKLGSIGVAVPNGELSLRDADGKEITDSPATGELCYRGRNVMMGYATCIDDLKSGDQRNGFLATGDIAYRDADGFYFIKGRISRFLKIYGNRIGLDECENILKSALPCEVACTGTDNRLVVYITDHNYLNEAMQALVNATHLPANVIEIREISELPKNEAGKILYQKLNVN